MKSSLDASSTRMLAATLKGPLEAEVLEIPRPEPGREEVLIKIARAGICGTDLHIFSGEYGLAEFPLVPGHEFAGTIVAVGEEVRTRRVGERVTADPNVPCMACSECKRNAFNQCENLTIVGVNRQGAFSEYVVVPERVVYPLGELPFAQAALLEPLACVVWGLKRVRPAPGDSALIYGVGPMGCLLLQAVKAAGVARAAVVDVSTDRLRMAEALGAELAVTPADAALLTKFAPKGFELVIDATGVPSVLENAIGRARSGGTVWVFGVAPEGAKMTVQPYELFRKDLSLVGSFAVNKTFQEAIIMATSGVIELGPLVSHVLPLSDFHEGLRIAREDPSRMKVQFSFSEGG